jgi:hypothetical protein
LRNGNAQIKPDEDSTYSCCITLYPALRYETRTLPRQLLIRRRKALAMDNLWEEVGVCFDTDDGSLPDIEVENLSPAGVSAVYIMIRRRSRLHGGSPEFWSRSRNESMLVDSVSDAAGLVAAGEAEGFHHCVEGLVAGGVELPILGVTVWPDCVVLDYQMGREWGSAQVAGFFELLRDCCSLDSTAVVMPARYDGPPYSDRFLRAWSSYKAQAVSD